MLRPTRPTPLLAAVGAALVRVAVVGYTPAQPSFTEVPMRLIGLAVVLAVSLALAPLAEAQRVPEVGVLVLGTERLSFTAERGLHELRDALRGFGWIDGQSITLKPRFADLSAECWDSEVSVAGAKWTPVSG